ncbi:DUF6572 domain-containing protein [Flavobacterium subsaxonicum]|uniref:Identified by metageneannotator n=1 Tax=Flavobacterium subsaxonicum WB 4.1-42 = DSM 21790 TaxID=1121898 RepID=A0A0A2MRP3_9FLAO|nr:DUF6572 domain-containing protein [Flavobacterium subsaxonicum]KGO94128.1 identified by metageneannotator [Flavobacterium subsaxonicum WB 4.1-42 = DSM 21790]
MAVDNKNVIDAISTDFEGVVVLTISDHLEWDDDNKHLLILQNKINVYLDVLQNGQIYESYPDSVGKAFRIQIALKYSPNKIGFDFLNQIQIVLRDNGYDFKYYHLQ